MANKYVYDAHVVEGSLEVNESLLTGELDSIYKQYGDALLSGSREVIGKCYVQVDKVGQDNYATSLVAKAQKVKNTHSELMLALKKATKFYNVFDRSYWDYFILSGLLCSR